MGEGGVAAVRGVCMWKCLYAWECEWVKGYKPASFVLKVQVITGGVWSAAQGLGSW